jgi:cytochrome c-type biogenesis protein CcmE
MTKKPQRHLKLLIAVLLVAAAILTAFFYSLRGPRLRYTVTVDQLLLMAAKKPNETWYVQGVLVSGSIQHWRVPECEYRFRIGGDEQDVEVRFASCVLPDCMADLRGARIRIVAQATLSPQGYLRAQDVAASCSPRLEYRPGHPTPEMIEPQRMD